MIVATIMISGLDIYLPAATLLVKEFETTDYLIKLTFGVGPLSSFLVCIPVGYFSDRIGRRRLYIISMISFTTGAFLAMVAPSLMVFFVGRFLLSLGSGALSVLSGAIIADLFTGRELAKYMGIYAAIFPAVFTLAPLLGAELLVRFGWRSIFLFLLGSMGSLCILLPPRLPETRRQKRKDDALTLSESDSLWKRLSVVFENPKLVTLGLTNALPICIGALFTFNSPFLFIENFGFTAKTYSWAVAIPVFCQFIGALFYRLIVQKIGPKKSLALGQYPCYILIASTIATVGGWLPEDPYFIITTISLFSFGSTWIISSSMTLLLDSSDQDKGLLNSLLSLTRNGIIFFVLTIASYFVKESITPIFITIGGLAALIILIIKILKMQNRQKPKKAATTPP
jgi:DHA1 family bicyclomycin/chloramphenicol resistance-like MFS transporter